LRIVLTQPLLEGILGWVYTGVMVQEMTMESAKVFVVKGQIRKPNWWTEFKKEVRALKPEDAVERVYREFGSRHRVKRFQMRILEVQEVQPLAGEGETASPESEAKEG